MSIQSFLIASAISSLSTVSLAIAPAQSLTLENFNTWTPSGEVSIPGLGTATLSTGGTPTDALLSPDLQIFLNVPDDGLDLSLLDQAYEGSALQKTFLAQAGDRFNFDWNFSTSDDDYAFLLVNGIRTNLAASGSFQYVFNTAGSYRVALGLVDIGDFSGDSTLEIRDGTYTTVPTPALLPGLIAFGVGCWNRRRANQRDRQ